MNVVVLDVALDLQDQLAHASDDPRRIACCVINPNQRSTWLIQLEYVGVKCM